MKRKQPVRRALATATVALLGASQVHANGNSHSETSILRYSERDRIRSTEIVYDLTRQLKNNSIFGLRITYDGLTGASPTGASPSKRAQTITRASGNVKTSVPAGAIPVDHSFSEIRFALDMSLAKPVNPATTITGAGHLSKERDYSSLGLDGGISHDMNGGNTTIGLLASVAHETVSALGGNPVPYDVVIAPGDGDEDDRSPMRGGLTKNIFDGLFSVTQIVDNTTIIRASFSYNRSSGYLTDPYKIFSFVLPEDSADAGEPVENRYEYRPGVRNKNAVFGEMRKYLHGTAVNLSYRFFWDDWGVTSHTADMSFRLDLKKRGAIQPHLRWYHQTRADFYHPFLIQGTPLPDYMSADSRLATFDAYTGGMMYSLPVSMHTRLNITAEYYMQRGDSSPPEAFGPLMSMNLFPDLDAVMLRLGLSHDF